MATRLRAADAECQVDLRAAPDADGDADLARARAAAVRRYLSTELGIAPNRILDQPLPKGARESGGERCVLVASLG
jgi:hypothetical protein